MKKHGVKNWNEYRVKVLKLQLSSDFLNSTRLRKLAKDKGTHFFVYDRDCFNKSFEVFVTKLFEKMGKRPKARRLKLINEAFGIVDEVKEEAKTEVKEEVKEEAVKE